MILERLLVCELNLYRFSVNEVPVFLTVSNFVKVTSYMRFFVVKLIYSVAEISFSIISWEAKCNEPHGPKLSISRRM